ncbi:unnamed protein product [Closterium sp. NIES-54]
MASPSVLTFDAEGRAVDFDVWLDDLQLFLQCDRKDGLSLFDLTSGASTALAADADSAVCSQWLTCNAAARLAVHSHLPSTERAHFSKYKSATTLYDAVVARYSSPATAALSRLMLPNLFPDLAAFATVTDLIMQLRTSISSYRAALPAEFCAKNPPPMYITLYYLVTRLPDTLRSVRDHFLSLCPTTLIVDPLEERLLAAETSITVVGASRGDPRTPFFEGCSPVPLLPSVASADAVDLVGTDGARVLEEVAGEEVVAVEEEEGVGVGVEAEVGALVAAVEVEAAVAVVVGVEAAEAAAVEVELVEAELGSGDPSTSRTLVRPRRHSSFVSGTQGVRGVGVLVPVPTSSAPATALESSDAILATMYAVSISAQGDCYVCVPPDPGIEAVALGARESAAPGASESGAIGADHTTLMPLSRPVVVSLADPSGGPVLARYSTVLPCPAAPSSSLSGLYLPSISTNLVSGADLPDAVVEQFTPASQRVTHCTCAQTGRHLATFTHRSGSSLYILTTESPLVAASGQVATTSPVFAAASRSGMASRVLVSGLPRSLPPLPPGPAPTNVPCVEGRQRTAPHSSEFPPTEAPLQTLHMDVWRPARVRGQGHERYFLLMVEDYSRYTTVFPLRCKGEVTEVLIDWIRAARLQLRERFGSDFPVLRLHSDKGREFSSNLLRAFCRAEGIRQTFTLPASPQQNGIAERRIGMVMDVARTSMFHVAAPHFLWPFAVQYAAHQINLQPRVSLPETSPTLRWTGKVGDASAFRVWGSRAFVRDLCADKLSSRAVPCGPAPSGVSQVDAVEPVEVAVDSESDSIRAASPTLARFLATSVTDPSFEFATASALVAELVDFAAHCRLDYATSLVAESGAVCPLSVRGECALSMDVLEDMQEEFQCFAAALPPLVSMLLAPKGDPDAPDIPTPRSYAEAIEGPYSSQWQAVMDAKMASWKSTGTYVNEVPPPGANIVSGMWIFRVKRPPGSPPVFKARYVARGFSQRQGVHYFQTFSPTPKMTTLWVLLHVAAQRDYELHSLDFSTAFLQGSLHEEIWLRRPPVFTGSSPLGTQWSLRRLVYGLRHAPREWHDTLRATLAALGFAPSTADPSMFLRIDALLPPFYILVYIDDLVFATADTAGLAHVKSELQKRHTSSDLGKLRSYLGL